MNINPGLTKEEQQAAIQKWEAACSPLTEQQKRDIIKWIDDYRSAAFNSPLCYQKEIDALNEVSKRGEAFLLALKSRALERCEQKDDLDSIAHQVKDLLNRLPDKATRAKLAFALKHSGDIYNALLKEFPEAMDPEGVEFILVGPEGVSTRSMRYTLEGSQRKKGGPTGDANLNVYLKRLVRLRRTCEKKLGASIKLSDAKLARLAAEIAGVPGTWFPRRLNRIKGIET